MEELLSVSEKCIEKVRIEFDKYQKKYFIERTPGFFCLELNGEAGELANNEKKLWKGREVPFVKLEDEAADVLIALMNYCNSREINLGSAVARKLETIEQKRKALEKEGKNY